MGILIGAVLVYLLLTLFLAYLLHQIPRRPVQDRPDWGRVRDIQIPAVDGGMLETWIVEPDMPSRGTVLLAHGWSRNRDRMTGRARVFAKLGFKTVLHSARDHGNSTPNRSMTAFRFAEDIEAILNWLDEPVLLYGHSAGAAGAILAASQHPDRVRLLFLEGSYARSKEGLRSLYRGVNPVFGWVLGPHDRFLDGRLLPISNGCHKPRKTRSKHSCTGFDHPRGKGSELSPSSCLAPAGRFPRGRGGTIRGHRVQPQQRESGPPVSGCH